MHAAVDAGLLNTVATSSDAWGENIGTSHAGGDSPTSARRQDLMVAGRLMRWGQLVRASRTALYHHIY